MKRKKTGAQALTPQEIHLIEQLRQHPELRERVHSILEIVRNEEGPLKTADEVEDLLIQELRRLGSATIPVLVEAGADLLGAAWVPLYSGTLTDGLVEISDPEWAEQSARFYRVRSPE